MGRRSNFPRIDKDAYDTPPEAVLPLLPYLSPGTRFIEPCGGKGALTAALQAQGHQCFYTCDIAPRAQGIVKRDALDLVGSDVLYADLIVTNPPWTRKSLHPLIDHLRQLRPTWLLFDAAWAHTQQAAPFLQFCSAFVTVGRVKWIPGTSMTAKDDAAWFRFDAFETQTVFIGKPTADKARAASHRVSAPALSLDRCDPPNSTLSAKRNSRMSQTVKGASPLLIEGQTVEDFIKSSVRHFSMPRISE